MQLILGDSSGKICPPQKMTEQFLSGLFLTCGLGPQWDCEVSTGRSHQPFKVCAREDLDPMILPSQNWVLNIILHNLFLLLPHNPKSALLSLLLLNCCEEKREKGNGVGGRMTGMESGLQEGRRFGGLILYSNATKKRVEDHWLSEEDYIQGSTSLALWIF